MLYTQISSARSKRLLLLLLTSVNLSVVPHGHKKHLSLVIPPLPQERYKNIEFEKCVWV